jgi:hypothetical protein
MKTITFQCSGFQDRIQLKGVQLLRGSFFQEQRPEKYF